MIWYIGRCIARLGHITVLVPAKGAANALREGVKVEGGKLEELQTGVIETADHNLLYPDPPLLARLKKAYPDLETRSDVTIISEKQLDEFYEAVRAIVVDKGVTLPE